MMPRTPKDILADSDIGRDDEYYLEDVYSSSQLAPPRRRTGSKRVRTSRAVNNGGREKMRKNSTPRDVEVAHESPSDATPLTRGDIPGIVSAVLNSIKATEAQEDNKPEVSTLPDTSVKRRHSDYALSRVVLQMLGRIVNPVIQLYQWKERLEKGTHVIIIGKAPILFIQKLRPLVCVGTAYKQLKSSNLPLRKYTRFREESGSI